MRKQLELEIKVGLFVSIGLGLIMVAILVLGSTENLLVRQNRYSVHFKDVEGLITGAKVVLGGIQVGTVDTIGFDQKARDVRVEVAIARKYADWIKQDSTAEITTQGVLGDKYINLTAGSPEEPILASGAEIHPGASKDLSKFLSKGDQLMVSLNNIAGTLDHLLKNFEHNGRSEIFFQGMASTAKNLSNASEKLNSSLEDGHLKSTLRNLSAILEKINNGTGTLGALVNDPGLYDDAKALVGGANRNRIVRNLVRQTIKKSAEQEAEEAAGTSGEKKRKK